MLDCELYSIYTEDSERTGSNKEFFYSFDKAMANRMTYANWWRPNGDVWIHRYAKNGCNLLECWLISEDGVIRSHYNYEKR